MHTAKSAHAKLLEDVGRIGRNSYSDPDKEGADFDQPENQSELAQSFAGVRKDVKAGVSGAFERTKDDREAMARNMKESSEKAKSKMKEVKNKMASKLKSMFWAIGYDLL